MKLMSKTNLNWKKDKLSFKLENIDLRIVRIVKNHALLQLS